MSELLTKISARSVKPRYTEVKVGDTVRVFTRIQEGEKTRTQYFDGLIIRRRGGVGPDASFTVRRIASGVGVERTFALHSPTIEKIEILRTAKVRRARLYTMRGLTGKAARLTEKKVDRDARDIEHPWSERYDLSSSEKAVEAQKEDIPATSDKADEVPNSDQAVKDAETQADTQEKQEPVSDSDVSDKKTADTADQEVASTTDAEEAEGVDAKDDTAEK